MSICSVRMNYCLIYGTSETNQVRLAAAGEVSYYLDYVTSKTQRLERLTFLRVNYCLNYDTSETAIRFDVRYHG